MAIKHYPSFLTYGVKYLLSLLPSQSIFFSTFKTASSGKRVDFGFAFNDKDFSDRVLHLQIIQKETESPRNSESLHISTPILAGNSPFFYKLFNNEMKESSQKDATLMFDTTEELSAAMNVLRFIYNNTLEATTSSELLAVLMAADKFEVSCCMEYCSHALLKLPISLDLAVIYIDLPPSVLTSEVVNPLIDASKKVLAAVYMDFTKSQEKAMELPLSAIEFVLTTDGLRVDSEDDVFDFVMKWSRAHYPSAKEREETLTKHLWPLVHFQYMSSLKLKEVLACVDVEHEHVSKLVSEALIGKEEAMYGQHLQPPKDGLGRRAYIYPLVKVVRLDLPLSRCVVYLNLRRDECANLFPSERLESQRFAVGGQLFYLVVLCKEEEPHAFGLFLKGESIVDFELAAMSKSSNDFKTKYSVKNHKFGGDDWGKFDLLDIPWAKFMSNDSDYFINDILHLRVKIILNNSD